MCNSQLCLLLSTLLSSGHVTFAQLGLIWRQMGQNLVLFRTPSQNEQKWFLKVPDLFSLVPISPNWMPNMTSLLSSVTSPCWSRFCNSIVTWFMNPSCCCGEFLHYRDASSSLQMGFFPRLYNFQNFTKVLYILSKIACFMLPLCV